MKKEDISVVSNAVMAFCTFIGVGGAIAYYLKEMRDLSIGYIILVVIIYILMTVILIYAIKGKMGK
jgi:amino acid transporter